LRLVKTKNGDYWLIEKEYLKPVIKSPRELKTILSKRTVSRKLTSSQQYILNEMGIVFENTDDEELKNRIKDLTKIFKKDLLPAVQKELREIKKGNLAGEKLIDALTSIGRSYGLFIDEDKKIDGKEVKEDKRAKLYAVK